MSIRRENLPPGDEPNRRRTMDTGRNDLLGEIAADAALERGDFLVQATDQLRRFLDRAQGADRRVRRPDADRRGARLPVDRRRTARSAAAAVPGRPHRRVGQRDRGHRDRIRARRALQPGRHLRGVQRGRPGGRRARLPSRPRATTSSMPPGSRPKRPSTLGDDPYAAAADSWAAGQPAERRAR